LGREASGRGVGRCRGGRSAFCTSALPMATPAFAPTHQTVTPSPATRGRYIYNSRRRKRCQSRSRRWRQRPSPPRSTPPPPAARRARAMTPRPSGRCPPPRPLPSLPPPPPLPRGALPRGQGHPPHLALLILVWGMKVEAMDEAAPLPWSVRGARSRGSVFVRCFLGESFLSPRRRRQQTRRRLRCPSCHRLGA
jgi:hypothetical protein